jgi:hypothetical protein
MTISSASTQVCSRRSPVRTARSNTTPMPAKVRGWSRPMTTSPAPSSLYVRSSTPPTRSMVRTSSPGSSTRAGSTTSCLANRSLSEEASDARRSTQRSRVSLQESQRGKAARSRRTALLWRTRSARKSALTDGDCSSPAIWSVRHGLPPRSSRRSSRSPISSLTSTRCSAVVSGWFRPNRSCGASRKSRSRLGS